MGWRHLVLHSYFSVMPICVLFNFMLHPLVGQVCSMTFILEPFSSSCPWADRGGLHGCSGFSPFLWSRVIMGSRIRCWREEAQRNNIKSFPSFSCTGTVSNNQNSRKEKHLCLSGWMTCSLSRNTQNLGIAYTCLDHLLKWRLMNKTKCKTPLNVVWKCYVWKPSFILFFNEPLMKSWWNLIVYTFKMQMQTCLRHAFAVMLCLHSLQRSTVITDAHHHNLLLGHIRFFTRTL